MIYDRLVQNGKSLLDEIKHDDQIVAEPLPTLKGWILGNIEAIDSF